MKKGRVSIEKLFEDDYIICLAKPAGITVIPERFQSEKLDFKQTVEIALGISLFTVHRIDRDTSGVVLFAKTAESHKAFSLLFENHLMGKQYTALAHGVFDGDYGEIDSPIASHPSGNGKMLVHPKGKPSFTSFKVSEQYRNAALLDVFIKTGRTHQIRVHLTSAGHPLLVDPLYGKQTSFLLSSIKRGYKQTDEEERPILDRLSLHAKSLSFEHPFTKEHLKVECDLPKDMRVTIEMLRKFDSKN